MKKAIALLSGGIDSPVAIALLQKDLDITAIHFHQMPLTDEQEIQKVKDLVKHLHIKTLYLVPFAEILKALVEKCNHRNYYVLSKIAMLKTAEMLAQKEKADYLITGENLGQVSSQTLSNMLSISKPIQMIILRPLLTNDKLETINKAKEIGTYEISKGPEICSLLGPENPRTRSDPEKIAEELTHLELDTILRSALKQAEILQL